MNSPESVIVLTGPTGSGKSGIIHALESSLPVEIVNADSRQIYKKMSIGTAAPSKEELARFPHHLFAFLDPAEKYSAGDYARDSLRIINNILERKKIPLIIGGTFFYIKSLWDGLMEEPDISKESIEIIESMPLEEVRKQLQIVDETSYNNIKPSDIYRNKRALLICINGGRPFSVYSRTGGQYDSYNFHSFFIDMPRTLLYERINKRTQEMFKNGLIEEISALLAQGYGKQTPALCTIGYQEVLDFCRDARITPAQIDENSREKLIQLIAQKSRNYAKRQMTWFRNEPRLKTIDHTQAIFLLSDLIEKISKACS